MFSRDRTWQVVATAQNIKVWPAFFLVLSDGEMCDRLIAQRDEAPCFDSFTGKPTLSPRQPYRWLLCLGTQI